MDKQAVTENKQTEKKGKITLEGWLFYLLLFSVIVVLPLASAIWLLSVA